MDGWSSVSGFWNFNGESDGYCGDDDDLDVLVNRNVILMWWWCWLKVWMVDLCWEVKVLISYDFRNVENGYIVMKVVCFVMK